MKTDFTLLDLGKEAKRRGQYNLLRIIVDMHKRQKRKELRRLREQSEAQ